MEEKSSSVKELHKDLGRKYKVHGTRVEQIWRSFGKSQREAALRLGAAEGLVLKEPTDRAMGNVYRIIPEWNLRDITEPESDYLLHLLKHRAMKSLCEQFCQGVNGGPGDAAFISNSMRINNLRHADSFKYCFTLFMDEDTYGQSFEVTDPARYGETMAGLSVAVNAGLCVPQSTGELILERQLYTLQALNILVEDILQGGSTSRSAEKRSEKPQEAVQAALSKLSIDPKPNNGELQELLASALDQKSSVDDYLKLCRTEAVFLTHVVNNWVCSRPELVQDEKGRTVPLITDKYISIAIFEVIHNAVAAAAIWDYLCRLLQALVDLSNDQLYKVIILQEMSNVCQLEYLRIHKLFRRHVQTGSGSKYFGRISGIYDNGIARVIMKVEPETLTGENPQVYYMLCICQNVTDAFDAMTWIKKLDDLHQSHPTHRDDMMERELDTFGDLAVIVGFVHSLSTVLSLPAIDFRKRQMYILRSQVLAAELDPLKTQIDLANFADPINNLTEPGMAEGALNALDQFIIDKTGAKMGFLYHDLIEECISDIHQLQKARIKQNAKNELPPTPMTLMTEIPSPAVRILQRTQKDKTRLAYSSVYDITPTTIVTSTQPETIELLPIFKVNQDTFEVFSTMFSKSKSRGSISWAAFEGAMTSLKFSVIPKCGSAFTFFPPQDFGVQKSLTVHRPHKSLIEGHMLLSFASRLKRVYGWGEQSFEVA